MNRQQFLLIAISALLFSGCKKPGRNYFTGTIEYLYSYTSDSLDADSIAAIRPAKGIFRYDSSAYQSQFFNKDTTTYYYSGSRNKCLSIMSRNREYTCEDYSQVIDSILSLKIYDTDEKILGYSCKILEMQKSGSRVKYYVSTDLHIAPATYQNHRSYNWDVYGEKANGGLILQSEHQFKAFTMKGIATKLETRWKEFKALEISDTLFSKHCIPNQ